MRCKDEKFTQPLFDHMYITGVYVSNAWLCSLIVNGTYYQCKLWFLGCNFYEQKTAISCTVLSPIPLFWWELGSVYMEYIDILDLLISGLYHKQVIQAGSYISKKNQPTTFQKQSIHKRRHKVCTTSNPTYTWNMILIKSLITLCLSKILLFSFLQHELSRWHTHIWFSRQYSREHFSLFRVHPSWELST